MSILVQKQILEITLCLFLRQFLTYPLFCQVTVPGQVVDVACGVDHMVALAKSLMWRVAGWRDGQRAADPGAGWGRAQRQLLPAGGDGPPVLPATHTDSTNSLLQQGQFKETFIHIFLYVFIFTKKISVWGGGFMGQDEDVGNCVSAFWTIEDLDGWKDLSAASVSVFCRHFPAPPYFFFPGVTAHRCSSQVSNWCLVVVLRHHSRMDGGSVFHLC